MTFPSGRTFTVTFGILLCVLVGASYSNSLDIGFLFDDSHGIHDNPAIRSLANIPRFFTDPFTLTPVRENVDVRPVLQVTYAINYAISGLQPWSYHLFNVLVHLVAAFLVFFIVRDHLWLPAGDRGPEGSGRLVAAAAAIFFALAPLNNQPIVYMWARSALLSTAFYLGAFLAYCRRRWLAMGILCGLALLTKAIAVTLPAMILVHAWLYRDARCHPGLREWLKAWHHVLIPVGVTALLALLYVGYRAALLPPWAESTRHQVGISRWTWFISQWSAELYYVRLFLWPDALSVDHDFPYAFSFWEPRACLSLLVILGWLALALRRNPRHSLYLFATLWFFVTLAPESTFSPLAEVVNDHRPYLASSLGLAVLLAGLLARGAELAGRRGWRAFWVATMLLSLAAVPANLYRNWQWRSSESLWLDAAAKGPGNGRAQMNAGRALMERGDYRGARTFFEESRQLVPSYPILYVNLSVLEAAEGNLDGALREAERAVGFGPGLAVTHHQLGRILERLGRSAEAADAYRRVLTIYPEHQEAADGLSRLGLGGGLEAGMRRGLDALYQRDQPAEAVRHFEEVLARMPDHYGANYQIAVALERSGRVAEARSFWTRTLAAAEAIHDEKTAEAAREHLGR